MSSYYVKLVGKYYKLNCVVKECKDEDGDLVYISQYGGIYKYVEKDKKKYMVNDDDWLEITFMEKIRGLIIPEPIDPV